ncbi:MAG: hypothetical protein ACYS22_20910 [Planctomycetota bacterium]|jgi:hypothetical protein
MSLLDWFNPEYSQARSLRQLSKGLLAQGARSRLSQKRSKRSLSDLTDDIGFVTMCLASLVDSLVEKGVITKEELVAHMKKVDGLDGVRDGKLDPNALRGATGMPKESDQDASRPRRKKLLPKVSKLQRNRRK